MACLGPDTILEYPNAAMEVTRSSACKEVTASALKSPRVISCGIKSRLVCGWEGETEAGKGENVRRRKKQCAKGNTGKSEVSPQILVSSPSWSWV